MTTDQIKPGMRWKLPDRWMYEWDGETAWVLSDDGIRLEKSSRPLELITSARSLVRVDPTPTPRDLALAALVEAVEQTLKLLDALLPCAQPLHGNDFQAEQLRSALAAWRAAQ